MRIIGIDPSIRNTGYAIIETTTQTQTPTVIALGHIHNLPSVSHSQALLHIFQTITELVEQHQPDHAAIEAIIYVQNRNTAITMGAARAAATIPLAQHKIPTFQYPPKSVKKSSTGTGRATKNQVSFMMRSIFKLTKTPTPDEADALAIALAHHQSHHPTKPAVGKQL